MSVSDRSSFQCRRSSTGGFLGPALYEKEKVIFPLKWCGFALDAISEDELESNECNR